MGRIGTNKNGIRIMSKVNFDIEVQTYQIDFVHHVSNIVYIEWMEIGRTKLLQAIGLPPENLEKESTFPVLVNTEIAYKKPIYYGDKVRAEIWISEMGHASAIMEFRFYKNGDILAAAGRQKGLFIDGTTQKPKRISPEQRERFEEFVAHN